MAKPKYERWLEPDGLLLIEGWARDGLTEAQICHNMDINVKTLWEWKKTYPQIGNALKKGREVVDFEVENALYKSAMGYEYTEETCERVFNKKTGQFELVVVKTQKKHVAPNTAAQIFWLKNRRPDKWRDKIESHVTTTNEDTTKTIADLINNPLPSREISDLIAEAVKEEKTEGGKEE